MREAVLVFQEFVAFIIHSYGCKIVGIFSSSLNIKVVPIDFSVLSLCMEMPLEQLLKSKKLE